MSIEAMKAVNMIYANTTKHDWPEDVWDAICQAIEAEKREWVGLTNEEREELMDNYDVALPDYAKAIEAKLKEKNNGTQTRTQNHTD